MKRKTIFSIIIAVILILTIASSFTIIPTGFTGVRTTFGQISAETVQAGFNLKTPFVQSINKVNNKQQDIEFENKIWSESSERTAVFFENVTVTYTINPKKSAWIYANVSNYKKALVSEGVVASSIKAAAKQLSSVDVTNRSLIEPLAQETLQKSLDSKYGTDVVIVNKVVINNIDFEDAYNKAIAEKQNAQLDYETQRIKNEKAVEKAAADADVKKTTAQGEADAIIIKAEAEAKANAKLSESLTDDIITNKYIEAWNGELPTVYGADGALFNVPLGK